jgi:hypothetical protein
MEINPFFGNKLPIKGEDNKRQPKLKLYAKW